MDGTMQDIAVEYAQAARAIKRAERELQSAQDDLSTKTRKAQEASARLLKLVGPNIPARYFLVDLGDIVVVRHATGVELVKAETK